MQKRPTKAQREQAEQEALKQRVRDWCYGSAGGISDDEPLYAELIEDIMRAVKAVFGIEDNHIVLRCWYVSKYGTIDSTTDFLYEKGFRADGTIKEAT